MEDLPSKLAELPDHVKLFLASLSPRDIELLAAGMEIARVASIIRRYMKWLFWSCVTVVGTVLTLGDYLLKFASMLHAWRHGLVG